MVLRLPLLGELRLQVGDRRFEPVKMRKVLLRRVHLQLPGGLNDGSVRRHEVGVLFQFRDMVSVVLLGEGWRRGLIEHLCIELIERIRLVLARLFKRVGLTPLRLQSSGDS